MLRVFQVDLDVTPILGTHNLDIQNKFCRKNKNRLYKYHLLILFSEYKNIIELFSDYK